MTGGVTLVFQLDSKQVAKPLYRQVMDWYIISTLQHATFFEHKRFVEN